MVILKRSCFVLLLIASGCARVPSREKAQMEESLSCTQTIAKARGSGGDFGIGDWPEEAWWTSFKDPTLTQLIERALVLSPTLQKAEARLKAAYQVALQKKSAFFPEIDFEANTNWQHLAKDGFFRAFAPTIPPLVNDITLGFSYSYEFDFWGKNRDLFRAALKITDALAAERRQAELILTTSIAYTYAQLQFLLRKRQLTYQLKLNTEAIEEIVRERVQNGIDDSRHRLQSQYTTLGLEASLVAIDRQMEIDRHRLKALAGLGQDVELTLDYHPIEMKVITLPENLELDLIARRPDFTAQRARVEAAAKEIHAAKTDFYPNVNLMGLIGLESVFASKLFEKANYSGNVMPALHLPIFTAGRLRAQLREKVAQFNEAVYAYNELILQVAQEIADRLTAISLFQQEIGLSQKAWNTSQKKVEVSKRRLEHALDNQKQVLEMDNGAIESEIKLVELEYGRVFEAILLIRALGGGYHG
jgi:NodT family efflux transporter outer membrane factor (OMF) lipoprotein